MHVIIFSILGSRDQLVVGYTLTFPVLNSTQYLVTSGMSSEPYAQIEQDNASPSGDDGLPTYDDLAAQNGPNSRLVYIVS